MRVSLNINNFSKPSFAQKSQSYNYGFNHGKNDGLVGSRSEVTHDDKLDINVEEYEKGYNSGYNIGKSCRFSETTTVTDIIQELIDNGTPRNEAMKFVSQYLGGW